MDLSIYSTFLSLGLGFGIKGGTGNWKFRKSEIRKQQLPGSIVVLHSQALTPVGQMVLPHWNPSPSTMKESSRP